MPWLDVLPRGAWLHRSSNRFRAKTSHSLVERILDALVSELRESLSCPTRAPIMTAGAEAAIAAATAANAAAASDAAAAGRTPSAAAPEGDAASTSAADATAAAAVPPPSPTTSSHGRCVDEVASAKPKIPTAAAASVTPADETPAAPVTPPHPPSTVSGQAVEAPSLPGFKGATASPSQDPNQWRQQQRRRQQQQSRPRPTVGSDDGRGRSPCSTEGHELPAAGAAAAASGGSAVAGTPGAEPICEAAAPSMVTGGAARDSSALLVSGRQRGALSFQARGQQPHRRASVSPTTVSAVNVPARSPTVPLAIPLSAFNTVCPSTPTGAAPRGKNIKLQAWGGFGGVGHAGDDESSVAVPQVGVTRAAAAAEAEKLGGGLRNFREPIPLRGSALVQPCIGVVAGDGNGNGNGSGQVPIGSVPWQMPTTAITSACSPRVADGGVAGDSCGIKRQLPNGDGSRGSPSQATCKSGANLLSSGRGGISWLPIRASHDVAYRLPQQGAGLQGGRTAERPQIETGHAVRAVLPWQISDFGQAGGDGNGDDNGDGSSGVIANGSSAGDDGGSGNGRGGTVPCPDSAPALKGVGMLQDEGGGGGSGGNGAVPSSVVSPQVRPEGAEEEVRGYCFCF